jgi:hypothetical protein
VGELLEARPIGVHQKDVATATIFPALCEDEFGAVGRPGGSGVFFPVDRVRELAQIAAISVGREDRGRGLLVIQKALPGDAASVNVGGCGGRPTRLLLLPIAHRIPVARQQPSVDIWNISSLVFSFSSCRLLKRQAGSLISSKHSEHEMNHNLVFQSQRTEPRSKCLLLACFSKDGTSNDGPFPSHLYVPLATVLDQGAALVVNEIVVGSHGLEVVGESASILGNIM